MAEERPLQQQRGEARAPQRLRRWNSEVVDIMLEQETAPAKSRRWDSEVVGAMAEERPLTGPSMNPTRTIGAALPTGKYKDMVYLLSGARVQLWCERAREKGDVCEEKERRENSMAMENSRRLGQRRYQRQ
jgi:hypothetical protein